MKGDREMNDKSIQLRIVCLLLTVVLLLSLVLIFPVQIAKASNGDLLQEYWVTNGCSGLGHGGTTWHAQTFTANSTHNVTAIELQFNRFEGSPGNVTVSIRNTDGSGQPTGSDLATSNPVNVDGLAAGNCSTVHFDFNSPFLELANGVKYAIVARAPDMVGSGLFIGYHNPGGYGSGEAWQSFDGGSGWMWPDNEPTFDLLFRIYGEGQAPPSEEEPPVEVGGDIYPVNKPAVLAPWLALAAVILAGTVMAARRYRARS